MGKENRERLTARLELRMTPTQKQELERVAAQTRRTMTSLAQEIIEMLIEKHPPK